MIKKGCNITMIFFILGIFFLEPFAVKADNRTLQDLMNQLNALQNKLAAFEEQNQLTKTQEEQIKKEIAAISKEMQKMEDQVLELEKKATEINQSIAEKEEQVKSLLHFFQLTNGESFLLEYIFGSASLKDFIYRTTIIEQMTEYNEKMITEMEQDIEKSKAQKELIEAEQQKLQKSKNDLLYQQEKLGSKINTLDEDARDIKQDIEDAKKTIQNYQKMGCKPSDYLSSCSAIPSDAVFVRPLSQGTITSTYGYRDVWGTGEYSWHYAVDIGGNSTGTPVYATASGRVVLTASPATPWIPGSSCGGNYVVVQHMINGTYYASRYMHLNKILVKENQTVTNQTMIGLVGGGESYDACSTGPHLDFALAKGIYGQDFYSFREPYTFNPVTVVPFPAPGEWFDRRL